MSPNITGSQGGAHTAAATSKSFLPAIVASFFILTFAIKAFVDDLHMSGEISTATAYMKYVAAVIACLAGLLYSFQCEGRVFVRQFDELLAIFLMFFFGSCVCLVWTGITSFTVFMELIKFVMPVLLAYAVLNAVNQNTMYRCMVIILLISILGYLCTLSRERIKVSDILSASFLTSDSATESSTFSGISLVLTLYFAFFRKRKFWLILATIFCILTFKRLALVVSIVACIISLFFPDVMKKRIPKRLIVVLKILTIAAVGLWAWLLLPNQEELAISIFGQDPRLFTMGRSETYRYLLSSGFQSYGFGSANEVVTAHFGMPFEMDLIKIAIELSPVVMILFVWLYWDVAGTSLWGVFIIGYFMLNMITSDSLSSNFCLTLAYITCGLVEQAVPKGAGKAAKERVNYRECPQID